jgi:hypothetical protein
LKDINFYILTESPYAEMKKFIARYQLAKYPNIITGFDYTHFFSNYYQVTGVPFIAVYGNDKKLSKVFEGKVFSKQIKKATKS